MSTKSLQQNAVFSKTRVRSGSSAHTLWNVRFPDDSAKLGILQKVQFCHKSDTRGGTHKSDTRGGTNWEAKLYELYTCWHYPSHWMIASGQTSGGIWLGLIRLSSAFFPPPHPQFPHTPTIPTGLNPRRLTIATFIFRTKRTCTLNCPLTLCDAQDSSYRISSNMGADILLSDFSHTHAREILQLFFVQILVAMNLCHKSTKCQSGNVNSQPRKTTTGLCAAERISRSVVCFH